MKLLTLDDYIEAGEKFFPKYYYVMGEMGEGAKPEDVLKVMGVKYRMQFNFVLFLRFFVRTRKSIQLSGCTHIKSTKSMSMFVVNFCSLCKKINCFENLIENIYFLIYFQFYQFDVGV